MTDIEIAKQVNLENILDIAKKTNIDENDVELYGKYKAKISNFEKYNKNSKGKLVLVTAMSPTPLGEGKTTISIAIADGLRKIGKKSILALREPSLGPVFGMKGGATGGGHAQVAPMEDINLHFTGDIHAITSANNLLSAMIDNHIYYGNKLQIEKVVWKRCVDLNDRQLRKIQTGLSGESKIVPREDGFDISVASEIMAIVCLSENIEELKQRLGNIIIGYNKKEEPIFSKDLKAEGAMAVLLKDAIKPNLVQTLEHTPAIIHGGPFANIAHGCNSVIATKLGMELAEYTVTEAGFGADLGAEKFIDIKCRKAQIKPDVVICVATIKALKYHGGVPKEEILNENIEALKKGMKNLYKHIDNLKNIFGQNVIVAINKFNTDTGVELNYLKEELSKRNIKVSIVESWAKGGNGAIDIAQKIVNMPESQTIKYCYDLNDSIVDKVRKVAQNVYGAENVIFSDETMKKVEKIEKLGYGNLPICIAKTQYSFSDNAKNIECAEKFNININDVELKAGAGFIVIYTGKIMTMPGLPQTPAAENIDISNDGEISGIF
ncbi:MAG TPA: formate--tetrahydrofolate ligase [Clostridiales bacterium]|jgi:formate--tetrahydrofolate ligase|nr:formate--tetrahydrofolate ligase [Clostridia bacterium]HCQ56239.1 formate--tetrahydrofolate ligase [Clostridiales bacterium]